MHSTIYTIVPDLPPNINGLGDYAHILASNFRSNSSSFNVEFIVLGNSEYCLSELNGIIVHTLDNQSAKSFVTLLKKLNCQFIHLHYEGYGYAKRGAPLWLYFGLLKWSKIRELKLITTFHELYAVSIIPWTSSFWNQILQKYICKNISLLSCHVVTSRTSYGKKLQTFNLLKKITITPVFSNLGELDHYKPLIGRNNNLVILGSIHTRKKIYYNYKNEINEICRKFNIQSIIDIGPFFGQLPQLNTPVQSTGVLTIDQISDLLEKNKFGLIGAYGSDYFAKSGVFAAYSAHGMLIVSLNSNTTKVEDGLFANHHYLTLDLNSANFNQISLNSYYWYISHSINKQIELYNNIYDLYFT